MDYRTRAVKCVKPYVLPEIIRQYEECGGSLDEQYRRYGDTEDFFAKIIEEGHIYEIGYPKCLCTRPQSEKDADPNFCECSRQSILYVFEQTMPDKKVTVETIETVLTGGSKCRFRVVVE